METIEYTDKEDTL